MSEAAPLNYDASRHEPNAPATRGTPRLWPGFLIIALQWLAIKIPAWTVPGTMTHFRGMMFGPMLGALAILIWWLAASRLTWAMRWTGVAAFLLGGIAASVLGDPTMRMPLVVFTLPLVTTLWVIAAAIAVRFNGRAPRLIVAASLLLTWGVFTLIRMDGLDGSLNFAVSWRWSGTKEDQFLASRAAQVKTRATTTTAPIALIVSATDWPAFRGPHRDGRLVGTTIRTDWAQRPPRELWKHLIGPGWSSFSAVGDRIFTQEQRGSQEVVSCYNAATGDELWVHQDATRFNEAMAGPGPRATPTFDDGKLYALGASGRLNCLDPMTGTAIWSRDIAADTGAKLPNWGFCASPLLLNGNAIVITGAPGKSVAAYNISTGAPAWSTGDGWSYCSAQLSKVGGVDQILYTTAEGVTGVDPARGQVIWRHQFHLPTNANRVAQPMVVGDNDLLIGAAFGVGTRRVKLTHDGSQWKDQEVWTSKSLRPYYNDMVLHKGHVYGFDGAVFTSIDAATGKPDWRASGYGNGQVLLLADQDLLLILSERGEVALVDAKPDAHHEIAKFQAIEGKTWNHPVIARGRLFVRNGEEVAAFALE